MNEKTSLLPHSLPHKQDEKGLLNVPGKVQNWSTRTNGSSISRGSISSGTRLRTNSVAVFNDLEDSMVSTVSTSYGPVVIVDTGTSGYGGVAGLLLAFFSGVLFTVNNFLFQYFELNVTDMLLTRSAMQAGIVGLVVILTGCSSFWPENCFNWFLVTLQSICAGGRVGLTFGCLKFLPIGDALTIIFSEPLWTLVLSKIFLKTRIGWWKLVFSLVLIFGVVLCTQPPFLFASPQDRHHHHHDHHMEEHASKNRTSESPTAENLDYFIGVSLAVGAALNGAASNIVVAKIEHISSSSLVTFSGVGGIALAVLFGVSVDVEDKIVTSAYAVTAGEWLTLLILGGSGLVGFFALTRSLQLIPPTTVAVLRALEIVLAYVVQGIVFGEVPNSVAVAGSSLVIISVIAFAMENVFLSCSGGTTCTIH